MKLNEIDFGARSPVDGYGPGFFRVAGEVLEGAVLLLPGGVSSWPGLSDLETILAAAAEMDVLLMGMGAEIAPLPSQARAALDAANIGAEPMSTPAACRTFNVLLAEGRRVGAALLPIG